MGTWKSLEASGREALEPDHLPPAQGSAGVWTPAQWGGPAGRRRRRRGPGGHPEDPCQSCRPADVPPQALGQE